LGGDWGSIDRENLDVPRTDGKNKLVRIRYEELDERKTAFDPPDEGATCDVKCKYRFV
jgi:hypothetical protein